MYNKKKSPPGILYIFHTCMNIGKLWANQMIFRFANTDQIQTRLIFRILQPEI